MIRIIERFFKNSSGAEIQALQVAEGPQTEAELVPGIERLSQGWRSGRSLLLLRIT